MSAPATTTTADRGHVPPRRRGYGVTFLHGDFFIVRHLARFLDEQLGQVVARGDLVADVGCGEQPLRARLEALGARYVGLDINQNSAGTVEHLCGVTALTLPTASVDVAFCTEVLEHVSETDLAFGELARVLRPGGRLVITVPFAYPLHEEPYDFVRLTPHQVRACAGRHGLDVVELRTAGNELEVIATVVDNMLVRTHLGPRNLVGRALAAGMRLVLHPLVMAANGVLGDRLPARYFLSTVAVLRKPA